MSNKQYCVYILTNIHNTVLYTWVTNDLYRRCLEHRSGKGSIFTNKYHISKLVYFDCCGDIQIAINCEKQIKAGSRQNKIDLINSTNPDWNDLFKELFDDAKTK
jgi:putative endonuclease